MRFSVELILSNETIPKDKNRVILSYLKHIYESYDKSYYKSLYEDEDNKKKSFTFSLYMPNCKFTREEIIIPERKMILNYSTANMLDGIFFYNAILAARGKPYDIKNTTITATKINMVKERVITNNYATYRAMSPVVVREHDGQNDKTWYHSLNDKKGKEVFMQNLRFQLLDAFGEERKFDIEEVDFELIGNKEVKVKNYGIVVLSNICIIRIHAKPYILDYLYKSGIGSRKSSGFGMLDLI